MKVLLAEDDEILGEAVEFSLRHHKYHVDWFKDGYHVLQSAQQEAYDVIVLDVDLPHYSGFDILKRLRQDKNGVAILILTAMDAIEDRVKGLDLGADDYMVKPFDMDEMLARVRSVYRRNQGRSSDIIEYKNIILYPNEHRVSFKGDQVNCAHNEFILLQKLIENRGRVYSQIELEEYLYHINSEVESNTVQVYIHHLRKKFGKTLIRTIRNAGYVID
jgi:Response regulators consisting of a CheY-like receiver domain and a winged-helix DNA-binding domain